jgi:hypothetical protein
MWEAFSQISLVDRFGFPILIFSQNLTIFIFSRCSSDRPVPVLREAISCKIT